MNSFAGTPIDNSAWSRAVRGQAARAAQASTPLLVSGPAGSGKSCLAQWLHHTGPRRDQPLITLDCARLPGTLFFGEAFGHGSGGLVRGVGAALGSLRAALGGTVVVENVDQLSREARRDLLLAMRDRVVTPLGTTERVPFAARIIATTRLDLVAVAPAVDGPDLSPAGSLSFAGSPLLAGLLARETVSAGGDASADAGHIRLAGLRERTEAIEPLVHRFLGEFSGSASALALSPAALDWLRKYDWPENIAELRRLVAHLVASGRQRIGRAAVERILSPNLSPWVAQNRVVERTRFPGLGVHRSERRRACSASAGIVSATCRKPNR